MRKTIAMIALLLISVWSTQVKAQTEQKLFNRLAIGVSASTMGIGIDASTTLNRYFMLRAGVDIMPALAIKEEAEVTLSGIGTGGYDDEYLTDVELEGSFKRVQGSVLLNIYPFKKSSFFLSAGAYFSGKEILKVNGSSPELKDLYNRYGSDAGVMIDNYKLPIDKNGNVSGSIEASGFRPYVGIGFGRAVPHKRVGFMFELGAQFHGKLKVTSINGELDELMTDLDEEGDISEILDMVSIYPVIKFRLCGRIF